jgi:hypothetical protein
MNRIPLSLPEIALISGTRAALGAGVGLLVADQLSAEQRRAVGWTLVGIGIASTVPIAMQLYGSSREGREGNQQTQREDASRAMPQFVEQEYA